VGSILAIVILGEVIALILGAVVGFVVAKVTDRFGTNRDIREILNFDFSKNKDLLFVFAHRPRRVEQEILPPVAVEDALAINNILTLLRKTGWTGRSRIRNAEDLEDRDKNRNIITLGGPKANTFTAEILKYTKMEHYKHYNLKFERDERNPDYWQLVRGNLPEHKEEYFPYPSDSYKVHEPEEEIFDNALVIKLSNPRDRRDNPKEPRNKVLVLAGVRGIGTWAASDHLRQHIREIYEKKVGHGFRRDGDFAAVIGGTYKKLDITHTYIRDFFNVS
jgi:hypothetical protein